MWHLSALTAVLCSSNRHHLLQDGGWLRLPCPRTGAWTSAIPIKVGFQHMLLAPRSLCHNQQQGNLQELLLLHSCHETTSTEKGRRGAKNPHLPSFAICTSLSIRVGGSQENDSGEFANVPLHTPTDVNRMSSTQHNPTPCYITEPLQCCKMQGERGHRNGQEFRAECLRDTDHYTLPLAGAGGRGEKAFWMETGE